jgi:predicted CXXCH cytochrome family protein
MRSLQVVLFLPLVAFAQAQYVGSAACKTCHPDTYERWAKTRMANVVRDPKVHPNAIIPDLSKPDPLVSFTAAEIAWVYGSKWKQRYFTKRGDDYYPLGAQWDVGKKIWRPYKVAANTDWWVPHFPNDNMGRPTGQLCDGCHSVNFNTQTKQVTEWNVGCEKCHGPGSLHAKAPSQANIVNPARLDAMQATDVCMQCHSEGRPVTNPVDGKLWAWPVGFDVGKKLQDYWKLEEFKLGEQSFTHYADGSGHKNRMQGNDFVQSSMYTHGVSCNSCHDAHGSPNNADLVKPASSLCLTCHGPNSPNGPRGATVEAHTRHQRGSTGNECVGCHMPKIAQQIADVNVRSHTFKFIPPSETESLKVPNSCTTCHTGKSTDWAREELRKWPNVSQWRVGR